MDAPGLFAHVNDSIRELAPEATPGQTWDFLCECRDVGCHELVTLTLFEFDDRRGASPPVPILAIDHGR
jgi:hypothetical protein